MSYKFEEGERVLYQDQPGLVISQGSSYVVEIFESGERVETSAAGLTSNYPDTERGVSERQVDILNFKIEKMKADAAKITLAMTNKEINDRQSKALESIRACLNEAHGSMLTKSSVIEVVDEIFGM